MNFDLNSYIESHIDPEPENLRELDRQTNIRLLNGRMCSGPLQGRVLKMLTAMIQPKRVLELGTFSGYSALCMAEAITDDASIDTIEIDDELEDFIRRALAASPHGDKVRLHLGDASELAKKWEPGEFDMIFIDADKRKYLEYYELCLPLLRHGGFILADNTLWGGHVVKDPDPRSPQTKGIIAFNDFLAGDTRVEKVILPLRDGLTIIRKL